MFELLLLSGIRIDIRRCTVIDLPHDLSRSLEHGTGNRFMCRQNDPFGQFLHSSNFLLKDNDILYAALSRGRSFKVSQVSSRPLSN